MLSCFRKKSKYFNQRVEKFGQSFDSKAEFNRWMMLKGFQEQGVISHLHRQVTFTYHNDRRYIADFLYIMDDKKYIEDVKSPALVEAFMPKARAVERKYNIKVTPVHPRNVTLHPKLIHTKNVLTF